MGISILNTAYVTHSGHNHGVVGHWIEHLIDKIPIAENWREFISHFVIDTLNVLFLLIVIMTLVYFLSSYINMDKLHHKMAGLKSVWGFALAIAAGIVCPFCSCSIIPVLMGLISMGVPVSVCLCYLTSASMINITALASIFAVTPLHFSITYTVCALLIIIGTSI